MKTAKIYSYTVIRSTIEKFLDRLPYCAAFLDAGDGEIFPALLEGYTEGMEVQIGQTVTSCKTDEEGNDIYSL